MPSKKEGKKAPQKKQKVEIVEVKAPRRPQPKPKSRQPNPSTGNVVGKIAEGLASGVPIVGPLLAPLAGAMAGGVTNALTSGDWSGSGDYKVKQNSFIDKRTGSVVSRITGTDGSTTMKYREFIGNVIASPTPGNFAHQAVRVNPADSTTFEWLGDAANKYGQYKLKGMIGILESQTSMTAPDGGSSLGRWGLNAQYNPAIQAGFTTLQENLQADGGKNAVTTANVEVGFECAPSKTVAPDGLYCSGGPPPNGMNYAQTDPFVINVWSEGVEEANAVLGVFYLLYEFEFMKKTLTPGNNTLQADIFQGEVDIQEDCFLGSEIQICAENSLGGTAEASTALGPDEEDPGVLYSFPQNVTYGRYLILVTTGIMNGPTPWSAGTWIVYPKNCSVNQTVLANEESDYPSPTALPNGAGRVGPFGGPTTTQYTGAWCSVCYAFFVDIAEGGAKVGIVWTGVTSTTLPTWSALSVSSFPRTVQFGPPPDLAKRLLFKNGASINRLAFGLETVSSAKEVAKITRQIRANLAMKGMGTDDTSVLRSVHLKKHREILKQYDFGRKKEVNTALEDEVKLLRAAVLAISKEKAESPPVKSDSDTDDETHLIEKMLHSQEEFDKLQRRLRRVSADRDQQLRETGRDPVLKYGSLEKYEKSLAKKRSMSYSTAPTQPAGAKLLSTQEFDESVRSQSSQPQTPYE